MGNNNTVRLLTWIVGAWVVSWGLMFSAPASTAACSPESAISDAHHALELVISTPLPNAFDGGDHESILDDQDPPEAEAPPFTRAEDAQVFAPIVDVQFQRVALPACTGHLDSKSLVEPRFLRYSRLLN